MSNRYYLDLIIELVKKELKVRYKNSVLGYLWSILSPLASALVFFIAFKIVIRLKIENYSLFLISGLFCWQWFVNSVLASSTLFLNNASLIKKVNFPRDSLIYSMVLSDALHFVLALPVIFLFIIIFNQKFSICLIFLPFVIFVQFFLISAVSLIVSSINLFFRDLERLVLIFTNLLFYLTPIIYPESMVPEKYKAFIYLNPMAHFVILYRGIFLNNRFEYQNFFIGSLITLVIFFIGYKIYKSLQWRFAEIV